MEKKNQWNTGYWIVALLLLLSLQSYWQTAKTVEPVPYSEFEKALAEGLGAALGDEVAADHDVRAVDVDALEDARVVRDDEKRPSALLAVGRDAARDHGQGVDVQAGVRLVEDGELGLQEQQLQHLHLLLLAAREAHVELAGEVGRVHVELLAQLAHAATELLGRHLELGALLADRAQEAVQRHARNLDGRLVGKEDARE